MRWTGVLLAAVTLITSGCKGDEKASTGSPAGATRSGPARAGDDDGEPGAPDEARAPEVSAAQYEALLLGIADCAVDEVGIDLNCPAYKALGGAQRSRPATGDWRGARAVLGRKHLKNASPAVRIQASSLTGSDVGTSAESQTALMEAATAEKNPRVLMKMLAVLSLATGQNPEVARLLVLNANSADAEVRHQVVRALTDPKAKGSVGTLEKAMEMAESDPNADLRGLACQRLGLRVDERVLPLLEKLTADPSADPKLYSACFHGVVAMWSAPLPHQAPSERAYRLSLNLLARKPRTLEHPPMAPILDMAWAKNEKFKAAAPWFKASELVAALADVVADDQSNWLARSTCIDVMGKLGATKADFERLEQVYAAVNAKPSNEQWLHRKLAEMVASSM